MPSDSKTKTGHDSALREALERESATREILQVISRSRDDEKPVFDAILESSARLCKVPNAVLFLVNDERTHFLLAADWGTWAQHLDPGTAWPLQGPLPVAQSIRSGRTLHIENIAETSAYRDGDPTYVHLVEEEGLRSRLCVPLTQSGLAIGAISLSRHEVRPFSEGEISLVETFAEQAVIAIENVQQFRELQARLEREAATREILQVISRSRADEQPVFEAIVKSAARLCDSPAGVGLHLLNEARTHSRLACSGGPDRGVFALGTEFDVSNELPQSIAMREVRVVHTPDLAQSPLYLAGDEAIVKKVDGEGINTFLCVPLVKDGVSIGCFNLNRWDVRPFTEAEIALAETFATQAVIAIENVRQFRELETLNAELEDRVAKQVGELERMGRLKRFLSPQVANAVVSSGDEKMLSSHRALIGVLFCDIRGFTAFCETAEPEETIEVLQSYHEEMGQLIRDHGAGVDTRSGDGIMVIFNDPLPCDDPAGQAVALALAMRARMVALCADWRKLGHRLGFGIGISLGYATVGMVGSSGRYDYTASGTAVNLAARLCDKAADGEILLSPRAFRAVEEAVVAESAGELSLKGIQAPVEVTRVIRMEGLAGPQGANTKSH